MDAETATVPRGRAKAALTRTKNFMDKHDQTFDKNDTRNKLDKLELTYTEFDKADAALPIESSEMEEFETKYTLSQKNICTQKKLSYIHEIWYACSVYENKQMIKNSEQNIILLSGYSLQKVKNQ
ncbi:hypothetical protein TNCV_1774531 [Trichonephila clavipes]|nr:hypothetical protein TNCV_1774531 [Trichonephila clavipes]